MLITNFASGELSPTLNGRVDLQQYYQGCSRLENFEIIPTGGIKRRVGSKRLFSMASNEIRIIPFILDKDNVFVFCIGPKNIRFYKIQSGEASYIKWASVPYGTMEEINEIQYAQNYDRLILVHRNYQPYEIKYSSDGSFTVAKMSFDFYPDVEVNDSYNFMMLCKSALPTTITTVDGHFKFRYTPIGATQSVVKEYALGIEAVFCLYNSNIYKYGSDQTWVEYDVDPDLDTSLFMAESKYPGCVSFFNNRLFLGSTKAKPGAVYASATPDTKDTRYNDFMTYKKYITVGQTAKSADIHAFTCNIKVSDIDTVNKVTTLTSVSQDFTEEGVLLNENGTYFCSGTNIPSGTKVVKITKDTIVIKTVVLISEDVVGQVMTIQLWRNPEYISAGDYEYSLSCTNVTTSDCALYFELASTENDAIKFMCANKVLAIGTESSIWSVDSSLTALNIQATMQGRYGSDELQGMSVAQAVVYFAQGKKGIREFYYDSEIEGFRTNNIAVLAEHLLQESPIVDFDYLSNPYSRILCTREDGAIVSLLYDKTNGVMGWNRITRTAGKITSVAVTRGEDENDYIFMTVFDNEKYYVEMIDPNEKVYLDSWQLYTDDMFVKHSDSAVLWNKTTDKTCEYVNMPKDFINSGDEVYIGYKIKSYIKSMPVIAGDPTSKKRITNLIVRFLDSYMPTLTVTDLPAEKFNTVTELPYSGMVKITYPGQSDRDVYFTFETDDVKEVNILSVNASLA